MILITGKTNKGYSARINGFNTTITLDELKQFIKSEKAVFKVNKPIRSVSDVDSRFAA